jgi:5-dehydro-2-deoxygluconokinase
VQTGGRFEDVATFAKYVGGSSANVAIGLARLGLRSSMLTRVGDEQMGRYVRETLAANGVDVSHVVTDPRRLTGLVLLGHRRSRRYPHIFFRENCADMAVSATDFRRRVPRIDTLPGADRHAPEHRSDRATVMQAVALARACGVRIVLDIDFRPVLWGLAPPGEAPAGSPLPGRRPARLRTLIAALRSRRRHGGGDLDRRRRRAHRRRDRRDRRAIRRR